jgi:hypothetical protein
MNAGNTTCEAYQEPFVCPSVTVIHNGRTVPSRAVPYQAMPFSSFVLRTFAMHGTKAEGTEDIEVISVFIVCSGI